MRLFSLLGIQTVIVLVWSLVLVTLADEEHSHTTAQPAQTIQTTTEKRTTSYVTESTTEYDEYERSTLMEECGHNGTNCTENNNNKTVPECDEGTYGLNCSLNCSCNATVHSGTCDRITGQCSLYDHVSGHNYTKASDNSSVVVETDKSVGISTNDLMLIVISSGSVLIVLIVGGSVIYRKKSLSRDNKEAFDPPAIENNAYGKGNEIDCIQPKDTFAEESEIDSSLQLKGAAAQRDDKDAEDKRSSDDEDQETKRASDNVLYEDADLELDSNKSKSDKEDEGDYDETNKTLKNDQCFQDDEVLYESADNDDDAITAKDSQNNYNTFEEVRKIRLNSTDHDKEDETEEDYNVLEHFNGKSKKMSLKHDDEYSTFDKVKSVCKIDKSDQEDESEYDSISHSPIRKDRAFIIHEQYHHIDLKQNTIDGEKAIKEADSTNENKESEAGTEEMVSDKADVIKDESRLSDPADVDYSFCEIDDGEVKLDIQEVIYDVCEPDENTLKNETQDKAVGKVSDNQNTRKLTEIVYESCEPPDEDETGNKAQPDDVYEDVSDDESGDHDINKVNESDTTKNPRPVRRRRSEDYEEFEL